MGTSSKKTKTTSAETATTQPNAPTWITQPLQDYTTKVQDFSNTPATQYVAPASPLQEQAFAGAQNLGGWQQYSDQALNLANQAAGQTTPQVTGVGYNAPTLGAAPQATAAQLGAAPQMTAAQVGNAPTFSAAGIDPTTNAEAFLAQYQGILDNGGIQKYLDPALESYINPALQAFDLNAGRQRAQMEAQAAGNRAFGGSRYGVQAGEFDANTALGRTTTEADLRRNAYQQAVAQALQEAANRSQVGMFNAGQQTQVSGQNAAANNARAMALAELEQQSRAANANMQGQYGLTQAQLAQQAAANNQNMLGQFGLQQGQFGQQANLANADAQQQFALQQAAMQAAASQFGAGATNTANLSNQQAAQNDYLRQLQAAGLIGDLGAQYGGQERQDLALTGDLGAQQYAINQAMAQAPLTQLQATGQLYGVLPYPQLVGQTINTSGTSTSKQSGGLLGSLLGAAATAASFAAPSDRRLKTDIERIGSIANGLPWYRFRYVWDAPNEPLRQGLMSDDVRKVKPEAVIVDSGTGFDMVNYPLAMGM